MEGVNSFQMAVDSELVEQQKRLQSDKTKIVETISDTNNTDTNFVDVNNDSNSVRNDDSTTLSGNVQISLYELKVQISQYNKIFRI